jgi:RNA polymerase sigma factor (sigma-70 family)
METRDLVAKAIAREAPAWEGLIETYAPLVWRVLRTFRSLEPEMQEDLFQDVFAVLLNGGLEGFRGSTEHEFRWYLKTITQNEAKNCLRRHGRRFEVFDSLGPRNDAATNAASGAVSFDFADSSPGPEDLVGQHEIRARLNNCIAQIPRVDQEIFWMREKGLDYHCITQTLGLAHGTVASKYHRAKEAIGECLRKAGIDTTREK